MKYAIIGAGMAGLACGDALNFAGHRVTLFDKGRGPGGRMSTRRVQTPLGEVAFDHGAQYFTARDPGFRRLVHAWNEMGTVEPWPPAGPDAWVGVPGMSSVIRQAALAHEVYWGHLVTSMARKNDEWWLIGNAGMIGPFDVVILAIPAEQATLFLSLHDFAMARIALMARSQPCWTSMFAFRRPLDHMQSVIRDSGSISWAARNSSKPGRLGTEAWVVQASASWSIGRLEDSQDEVSAMLFAALSDAMDSKIPAPVAAVSHRWRYALCAGTGDGELWNPDIGLGVCGDWLLGPRVECAWLSGRKLAERCIARDQVT
jgi:renalase